MSSYSLLAQKIPLHVNLKIGRMQWHYFAYTKIFNSPLRCLPSNNPYGTLPNENDIPNSDWYISENRLKHDKLAVAVPEFVLPDFIRRRYRVGEGKVEPGLGDTRESASLSHRFNGDCDLEYHGRPQD